MRVVLVSLSAIEDDPRVRRHGDALMEAGWTVTGVGLGGHRSPAPQWRIVHLPDAASGWVARTARALRLGTARALPEDATALLHASDPVHRDLVRTLRGITADLFVANDWATLPAVAAAAARGGSSYAYDSHEYGPGEFADRWRWRLLFPRYISALERRLVPGAALTLTVSGEIARTMRDRLSLAELPLVVRNVPPYQAFPMRRPADELEVLYHGVLAPDRGLEPLLAGARGWGPGRRLVLRGPGHAPYVAGLRAQVESWGLDHIRIEPPVPPAELVSSASMSDIGIFVSTARPEYRRFLLPNKLFEYTMAGLALCVSDTPEMASLVREHDLGVLVPEASAEAITKALDSLDHERVIHHRNQALHAARTLNWEQERGRLQTAFARLV